MSPDMPPPRCELCAEEAPSDYFSWTKCNATGVGVLLCEPCCEALEGMSEARGVAVLLATNKTSRPIADDDDAQRWRYVVTVFPNTVSEAMQHVNSDHPTWNVVSVFERSTPSHAYAQPILGFGGATETVVVYRVAVE